MGGAAELGHTTDPKKLVPGDPGGVLAAVEELKTRGRRLETVAEDLRNVRIAKWTGPAAAAFWEKYAAESPQWSVVHDQLNVAATALSLHSETLRWAQTTAAEAVALWEKGDTLTKTAGAAREGQPSGETAPTLTGDPGDKLRAQAQELLKRARNQLLEVGNKTTLALGGRIHLEKKSYLPGDMKVGKDKKFGDKHPVRDKDKHKWGHQEPDDGQEDKDKGPDVSVKLADWEKKHNVLDLDLGHSDGKVGDVTVTSSAGVTAGVEAGGSLSLGNDGLKGTATASIGVTVTGEGKATYGIAEGSLAGKVFAGAEAEASLSAGKDGLHAGASAFAGVRAEGELKGDVGGIGAGVKAEGWIGAGAEANVDLGVKDGKLVLGGDFGVGLGIGGKIGGEIVIDPGKVADSVDDVADKVGDTAGDAVHKMKKLGGRLFH
ncbi:putative T7SS-secreted protein [Amycolatopsis sp. H20-H5]|uniref:putative T7SS-secreted protein n=1 Tax=Amycolatopsis sp. H20-H5 TaxID=3046309 RepID=UPI002DB8D2DF|nr:hypothetical protein [Amycolatopsis sp. H20-H5]MEC3981465.1 hypothetical protein [Amycolatopsis sp. H20-H5]